MSLAHLRTVGTLSYNGYTFDGSAEISVKVDFVTDDADRTVLYHRHLISVRTFVHSDAGTDDSLEAIRAALSHQGQTLIFVNKGFGDDLIVNRPGGGGLRDVKFGPKPRVLSWDPVGSSQACELAWECEVCVPKCGTVLSGRSSGVMAMNYVVSLSVDKRGLTTRTIAGYLEIAQTRRGYAVPDSADNYKHLIAPPTIDGFGRSSDWQLSPDKSRIEFAIVDTQVPSRNPYPALVTQIDADHRGNWDRGGSWKTAIHNTISMDIETVLGAPRALAWQIFANIVSQRIATAKKNQKPVFLDGLSVAESIFGLKASFSCDYRVLMDPGEALNYGAQAQPPVINGDLFDFAKAGFWEPVSNVNWSQWRTSLAKAFSNRGLADLRMPPQLDVIVDLCTAGKTPFIANTYQQTPQTRIASSVFKNERPDPRRSYLKHRVIFVINNYTPTVRQSPMQPPDQDSGNGDPFSVEPLRFPTRGNSQSQESAAPDTIQQSGPGQYSLTMIGTAERAGYQIPRPRIVSVGGQVPVEAGNSTYVCEQLGTCLGVPVYRASWSLTYLLASAPTEVNPPVKLEA